MRGVKWFVRVIIGLFNLTSQRTAPAPKFPGPQDRDEAWRQDIIYLRDEFPKVDRSFTQETLPEFTSILNGLYGQVTSLSDNEVVVEITRAAATSGNGHTRVFLMRHGNYLNRLPIRFYWFSNGLFVVKATVDFSETLGARMMAINGHPSEELMSRMRELIPGSDSWVLYKSSYLLNSPNFLHGLGVTSDPDTVPITFQSGDGTEFTLNLSPSPIHQRGSSYEAWVDLSPFSTWYPDGHTWLHVLADEAVPLYLQTPNTACSYKLLAGSHLLYIQINRNISDKTCNQSDFAGEIKQLADSNPVEAIIFDLRFNTGGNYLETLELTKGIPIWFESAQNIYIVNGPATFSAGIVSTARLKHFSGKRAIVVGEPAGDSLKMWAEGPTFTLPNSRLQVKAATDHHDWAEDSFELGKTHFPNLFHGVAAGNIDVDLPVTTSFQDYLSGRDPVLEAICAREG
jgi:hypothetical protein